MISQKPIFKASLSCISDFARSKGGRLSRRFALVFEKLISCMSSDIDGEIKIKIMQCLGDICLGARPYSEMFIDRLIQLSNDCM